MLTFNFLPKQIKTSIGHTQLQLREQKIGSALTILGFIMPFQK
jgi:hypothetical protein